jgi:hypothetical protein
MLTRLVAADIRSRDGLLKWLRARYPKMYRSYSLFSDGNGRQCAEQIWANYLEWLEVS